MKLIKKDDYRWEIPVGYKEGMKVPGVIYSDDTMIEKIKKDNSFDQVANGATLPGVVKASLAMPDIHFGYGLPIGGVVAFDLDEGIVSPGGTGYDINCGVRLIRSNITGDDVKKRLVPLIDALYNAVPTGVGSKGKIKLSIDDEKHILLKGTKWAVEAGFGSAEDLRCIESNGTLEGVDLEKVSERALERGRRQQGTLGSGNHFLEVQVVDAIYDEKAAHAFGLEIGMAVVMIHTGSRGFGHQVCTDYLEVMKRAVKKYNITLYDRQLACAPVKSREGQDYLSAMRAAANYAWVNRQILMTTTMDVFQKVFGAGPKSLGMSLVYDVAHNIIKIEEHTVDNKVTKLAVHRKGATRSFPAHHPELPEQYREVGQPVIIPGDMGTNSYVLSGTRRAMQETFGSTCHGAGRVMSRHAAVKAAKGRAISRELEDKGIIVRAPGVNSIKEEMPDAYKDISKVVEVVHNAGISKRVARMRPLGVIKG